VVCDEHGIGGSGEYCGNNDAHLERINVFYHEAFGGKYVSRAAIFDLEFGMIGVVTLSRRSGHVPRSVCVWGPELSRCVHTSHQQRGITRIDFWSCLV
jgi:hypothetical protein